jgi:hypothetical protein
MTARYVGWIIVTTGMITLLPLMLEVSSSVLLASSPSPPSRFVD